MINTVEQDQGAVWSGSAVFITQSSYMINTVEQKLLLDLILQC